MTSSRISEFVRIMSQLDSLCEHDVDYGADNLYNEFTNASVPGQHESSGNLNTKQSETITVVVPSKPSSSLYSEMPVEEISTGRLDHSKTSDREQLDFYTRYKQLASDYARDLIRKVYDTNRQSSQPEKVMEGQPFKERSSPQDVNASPLVTMTTDSTHQDENVNESKQEENHNQLTVDSSDDSTVLLSESNNSKIKEAKENVVAMATDLPHSDSVVNIVRTSPYQDAMKTEPRVKKERTTSYLIQRVTNPIPETKTQVSTSSSMSIVSNSEDLSTPTVSNNDDVSILTDFDGTLDALDLVSESPVLPIQSRSQHNDSGACPKTDSKILSSQTVLNNEGTLDTLDLVSKTTVVPSERPLQHDDNKARSKTDRTVKETNGFQNALNENSAYLTNEVESKPLSKAFESKPLLKYTLRQTINAQPTSLPLNSNVFKSSVITSQTEKQTPPQKLFLKTPLVKTELNEKFIDAKKPISTDVRTNSRDLRGSSTIAPVTPIIQHVASMKSFESIYQTTNIQSQQCFAWNLLALFYVRFNDDVVLTDADVDLIVFGGTFLYMKLDSNIRPDFLPTSLVYKNRYAIVKRLSDSAVDIDSQELESWIKQTFNVHSSWILLLEVGHSLALFRRRDTFCLFNPHGNVQVDNAVISGYRTARELALHILWLCAETKTFRLLPVTFVQETLLYEPFLVHGFQVNIEETPVKDIFISNRVYTAENVQYGMFTTEKMVDQNRCLTYSFLALVYATFFDMPSRLDEMMVFGNLLHQQMLSYKSTLSSLSPSDLPQTVRFHDLDIRVKLETTKYEGRIDSSLETLLQHIVYELRKTRLLLLFQTNKMCVALVLHQNKLYCFNCLPHSTISGLPTEIGKPVLICFNTMKDLCDYLFCFSEFNELHKARFDIYMFAFDSNMMTGVTSEAFAVKPTTLEMFNSKRGVKQPLFHVDVQQAPTVVNGRPKRARKVRQIKQPSKRQVPRPTPMQINLIEDMIIDPTIDASKLVSDTRDSQARHVLKDTDQTRVKQPLPRVQQADATETMTIDNTRDTSIRKQVRFALDDNDGTAFKVPHCAPTRNNTAKTQERQRPSVANKPSIPSNKTESQKRPSDQKRPTAYDAEMNHIKQIQDTLQDTAKHVREHQNVLSDIQTQTNLLQEQHRALADATQQLRELSGLRERMSEMKENETNQNMNSIEMAKLQAEIQSTQLEHDIKLNQIQSAIAIAEIKAKSQAYSVNTQYELGIGKLKLEAWQTEVKNATNKESRMEDREHQMKLIRVQSEIDSDKQRQRDWYSSLENDRNRKFKHELQDIKDRVALEIQGRRLQFDSELEQKRLASAALIAAQKSDVERFKAELAAQMKSRQIETQDENEKLKYRLKLEEFQFKLQEASSKSSTNKYQFRVVPTQISAFEFQLEKSAESAPYAVIRTFEQVWNLQYEVDMDPGRVFKYKKEIVGLGKKAVENFTVFSTYMSNDITENCLNMRLTYCGHFKRPGMFLFKTGPTFTFRKHSLSSDQIKLLEESQRREFQYTRPRYSVLDDERCLIDSLEFMNSQLLFPSNALYDIDVSLKDDVLYNNQIVYCPDIIRAVIHNERIKRDRGIPLSTVIVEQTEEQRRNTVPKRSIPIYVSDNRFVIPALRDRPIKQMTRVQIFT